MDMDMDVDVDEAVDMDWDMDVEEVEDLGLDVKFARLQGLAHGEDGLLEDQVWIYKLEKKKNSDRVTSTCIQQVIPYINVDRCELAVQQYNTKHRNIELHEGETFDWRALGALSDIRDQGLCGCCYAVTSADNIMAVHQINLEELDDLSWQEIIDHCPWTQGCGGGTTLSSYMYVLRRPGGD